MDTALATATMAATRAPTTALDEIGIGSRIDDFDLLTDLGAARSPGCTWPGSGRCSASSR